MVSSINTIMYNLSLLNDKNSKVVYSLSSGNALQYGSDDASKYSIVLSLQDNVNTYTAIQDRIALSSSHNSSSDSTLSEIKTAMESINSEILKSMNDTLNSVDKETISTVISSLKDSILCLANQEVSGQYLFSGSDTSIKPFIIDETTKKVSYVGNNNNKTVNVDKNNYVNQGVNGLELFYYTNDSSKTGEILTFDENEVILDDKGNEYKLLDTNNDGTYDGLYLNADPSSTILPITNNGDGTFSTTNTLSTKLESKHSFFDDLDDLINTLNLQDSDGNTITQDEADTLLNEALNKFETAYDNTNSSHALLGTRTNTIDKYDQIIQTKLTHFTLLEEEFGGADLTQLAVESQSLENTYTALFSTINKVNSLSLVNYLN